MAKKNAKPVKKKPATKKAAKPAKKPAKPAKKLAAPKKVAAPKKAAPVKAAAKPTAKKGAAPAKAVAPKKVELKKAGKAPIPETKKAGKPEKAAKGKAQVEEVEELPAVEEPGEDEEAEIVLTDAEGRRYCRVKDCDQLSSVDGYCRYHYLLFWKKIQVRKKILTEGKLERYVEDLTARYPDKFLEILRKDLRTEKDFQGAIQELEIDESAVDNEFEDEAQTYIDEVRGDVAPAREEEDF